MTTGSASRTRTRTRTLPTARRAEALDDHRIHLHIRTPYRQRGRAQLVRRAASAALAQARHVLSPVELTLRLTDDAELRRLNKQFRGIDQPTDVLSFGGESYVDGHVRQGHLSPSTPHMPRDYLGDVVISMERCEAQAQADGHSVDDELALLVVHGVLHLLGYDHHTAVRRKRMWQAQDRAFGLLDRTNPLHPGQFEKFQD